MIMQPFLQIPISCLTEFLSALERGYCKYNNPYHNHVHAADVTQTLHCLLLRSGLVVQKTNLDFLLKDKDGVITFLFNFLKIPWKNQKEQCVAAHLLTLSKLAGLSVALCPICFDWIDK